MVAAAPPRSSTLNRPSAGGGPILHIFIPGPEESAMQIAIEDRGLLTLVCECACISPHRDENARRACREQRNCSRSEQPVETGMCSIKTRLATAFVTTSIVTSGLAQATELPANDYPTAARADYVFACMQVNGRTREALRKCACSIDVIASLLPYEKYEEAETVMSIRQRGGEQASIFLSAPQMRAKVDDLKRAQVEAELRCF